MTLQEVLRRLGACGEGVSWATGKTLAQAYRDCASTDDMIWFARRIGVDDKILHALACQFARRVVYLTTDPRSEAAIVAKERWLRGEISDDELAAA